MYLLRRFARSNCLNRKRGEIGLRNLQAKLWILGIVYNRTNGQTCINGGYWRNFCFENGSFYKKFVRNRILCSKPISEGLKSALMKQNKFLKMTFKPYMFTSGHLCLPRSFVRDNGIKEGEEITLVDKDGVKWLSYVACSNEQERFYLAKGWRRFCAANRFKSGESFTLEFVREGTTPMLKFCSKEKLEQAPKVQEEVPKNLQCKQQLQHLTISDHVKKVKQSILDTLIGIKQFRSELKIKEQNLEASLKDIDALGKKVLEINKILK